MKKFVYGKFVYEYELIKQNRKTLSLTVRPDLKIVLKTPIVASDQKIEEFLQKKWFWLEKQIALFNKYKKKEYHKDYTPGEGFLYLGKQYTLKVGKHNSDSVVAKKGVLTVNSILGPAANRYTRLILERWYRNERKKIFETRLNLCLKLFDFDNKPNLVIRDMSKRWGSYINKQTIALNPKLVQSSVDCIDYVIIHELCHFKHRNHNKSFYSLLSEKLPNWKKTKEKLEMYKL